MSSLDPSSHVSNPKMTPSPQIGEQVVVVPEFVQFQPAFGPVQVLLQPVPPSSHVSVPTIYPSPHFGEQIEADVYEPGEQFHFVLMPRQLVEQPILSFELSSHSSPATTSPSPHIGLQTSGLLTEPPMHV